MTMKSTCGYDEKLDHFTDDDGNELSDTSIETLCIVEESDERWPPYRLVNKTDIKLRYRQRLAKQNFPKEVADFDGELSTVKDTSFTLASLNHASKPRGPRPLIVQPRNDQKKQGLKVTGNDDEAPDDEIGNASKFVKQSSMSTELERAASSPCLPPCSGVRRSLLRLLLMLWNEVSSTWARRLDPVRGKSACWKRNARNSASGPGASWNPVTVHRTRGSGPWMPLGRLLVLNGEYS